MSKALLLRGVSAAAFGRGEILLVGQTYSDHFGRACLEGSTSAKQRLLSIFRLEAWDLSQKSMSRDNGISGQSFLQPRGVGRAALTADFANALR